MSSMERTNGWKRPNTNCIPSNEVLGPVLSRQSQSGENQQPRVTQRRTNASYLPTAATLPFLSVVGHAVVRRNLCVSFGSSEKERMAGRIITPRKETVSSIYLPGARRPMEEKGQSRGGPMRRTRASDEEFSIFSLNIDAVHTNYILGKWTHTFHAERLGVIEIIFLKDVILAVVVVFA